MDGFLAGDMELGERDLSDTTESRPYSVLGSDLFVCNFPGCGKIVDTRVRMNDHLRSTHFKRYHCQYRDCGYRAARPCLLRRHEYMVHGMSQKQAMDLTTHTNNVTATDVNDTLDLSIPSKAAAKKKEREESLLYSCSLCTVQFRRDAQLKYHVWRDHRNSVKEALGHAHKHPMLVCPICKVAFLRSTALRNHMTKFHKDDEQTAEVLHNLDNQVEHLYVEIVSTTLYKSHGYTSWKHKGGPSHETNGDRCEPNANRELDHINGELNCKTDEEGGDCTSETNDDPKSDDDSPISTVDSMESPSCEPFLNNDENTTNLSCRIDADALEASLKSSVDVTDYLMVDGADAFSVGAHFLNMENPLGMEKSGIFGCGSDSAEDAIRKRGSASETKGDTVSNSTPALEKVDLDEDVSDSTASDCAEESDSSDEINLLVKSSGALLDSTPTEQCLPSGVEPVSSNRGEKSDSGKNITVFDCSPKPGQFKSQNVNEEEDGSQDDLNEATDLCKRRKKENILLSDANKTMKRASDLDETKSLMNEDDNDDEKTVGNDQNCSLEKEEQQSSSTPVESQSDAHDLCVQVPQSQSDSDPPSPPVTRQRHRRKTRKPQRRIDDSDGLFDSDEEIESKVRRMLMKVNTIEDHDIDLCDVDESGEMGLEESDSSWRCHFPGCAEKFPDHTQLRDHQRVHKAIVYCPHKNCTSGFYNYGYLRRHILHCHVQPEERKPHNFVACKKCGLYLKEDYYLKKHAKHCHGNSQLPCTECDKTFAKQSSLTNHMKAHFRSPNKDKKYMCKFEGCDKKFTSSQDLSRHTNVHTGARPYVCRHNGCTKSYKQYGHLLYHTRNSHVKRKEPQTYICPFCNNIFNTNHSYTAHIRYHCKLNPDVPQKQVGPNKCVWCGEVLENRKMCSIHMKQCEQNLSVELETPEDNADVIESSINDAISASENSSQNLDSSSRKDSKTFVCPYCGNLFTRIHNYTAHIRHRCKKNPNKQQGPSPNECVWCGAVFPNRKICSMHIRDCQKSKSVVIPRRFLDCAEHQVMQAGLGEVNCDDIESLIPADIIASASAFTVSLFGENSLQGTAIEVDRASSSMDGYLVNGGMKVKIESNLDDVNGGEEEGSESAEEGMEEMQDSDFELETVKVEKDSDNEEVEVKVEKSDDSWDGVLNAEEARQEEEKKGSKVRKDIDTEAGSSADEDLKKNLD